ncbi:hypothetical protein ACWGDT_40355, partial [Streptomyces avermitilis]
REQELFIASVPSEFYTYYFVGCVICVYETDQGLTGAPAVWSFDSPKRRADLSSRSAGRFVSPVPRGLCVAL